MTTRAHAVILASGLAIAAALPLSAAAATQTATLSFSRNDTALGGGSSFGFNRSTSFNAGLGRVFFGAEASSGDVDASASVSLRATYDAVVDFASAAATRVALSLTGSSFSFATFTGATAFADLDLYTFLGINPPRFSVIDDVGYQLRTSTSGSGLGRTISDRENEPIVGFGPNGGFGLLIEARITLDASQTSTFRLNELEGIVRATHESGATRTGAFDIFSTSDAVDLDLSLPGDWDLDLVGVALRNTFDTSLGLAASSRIGVGLGDAASCGDLSDDDDNLGPSLIPPRIGCAGDAGAVASSPQLTLSDPSGFEIAWGTRSADIGGLTVLAAPVPPAIPLPGSMVLLAGGLAAAFGGLGLGRRVRQG